MCSSDMPMIWVHATIDDTDHAITVVMRRGESLDDAMGRGVAWLLDEEAANYATKVWTETADFYEVDAKVPLMDGQIPGVILHRTGDRQVTA